MKKRKQSFLHLVTLLAFLALMCAGVFWAIQQQFAPNADAQDGPTALTLDDLTPLSVPLLSDEACSAAAQEMVEQLPDSPIIARVEATSSSMSHDGAMVQRFYVTDVYAGEGLQPGDLIWLTSSHWSLPESPTSDTLQTGYVNLPQNNWEYLVFLQGPAEEFQPIYDQPVYQLRDDLTLASILCCTDWNDEVEEGQGDTMLYNEARWHEFCTQTQQGMDTLMKAKHQVMEQFPQED